MRTNRVLLMQAPAEDVYPNPPLGLAYLGAVLERAGHEVLIIDATGPYADYTISDLVDEAREFAPDIIGVTITVYSLKYSYPLLRALSRAGLGALIVAGGPHSTLLPDEVLQYEADVAVRHDGEETILELVEYIQGKKELKDIKGISYRGADGKIWHNSARPGISDLDALPFPAKHLFRQRDYIGNSGDYERFGNIVSSRGCPYQCTYCSKIVRGKTTRFRTAQNVLDEILSLTNKYGITRFRFIDDIFTVSKKRVKRLCDLILERYLSISWTAITRLDCVDRDLLSYMKEAGCRSITYGVESGNQETLERIRKGFTKNQAREAIKMTHEMGINCSVNFMWGFPWETADDVRGSADFVKELLPFVTVVAVGGILIPFPGTDLYEEYAEQFQLQGWWLEKVVAGETYTANSGRAKPVLYRELFFDDSALEWNFFEYPREIIREMRRAMDIIGQHNMWIASARLKDDFPWLPRHLIHWLLVRICKISKALYGIGPRLERVIMKPLMRTAKRYQHLN